MSTLWWLVVLWLVACFACLLGYVIRAEFERYHRYVYDVDFTRKQVGT